MAYRKTAETVEILETLEKDAADNDFEKIRCPLCKWSPKASSRWCCSDADAPEYFYNGCYTIWNTFETRGKCPGCGYRWRWTTCLACHQWSRHEDWYVKNAD